MLCEGNAVDDTAAKGNLVSILQIVANGYAAGDSGDADSKWQQLFVEIEGGGVALHGGGECKDDLLDGRGDALLDALDEGVDVEVVNADAVDG